MVFWVDLNSGIPILGISNLGIQLRQAWGKFFRQSEHRYFVYFSFLAYQKSVQLLYETLNTLIEALATFTVRQS